jgi:hypothetical protein
MADPDILLDFDAASYATDYDSREFDMLYHTPRYTIDRTYHHSTCGVEYGECCRAGCLVSGLVLFAVSIALNVVMLSDTSCNRFF